jgi:molecular chaperone DnaJ
MIKDYYIALGVSRGANINKIKKAYRTVIKKYHPDITRTKESTSRFLEIKEAYDTLSNESKRKNYDKELSDQLVESKTLIESGSIRTRTPILDEIEKPFFSFTDDFFEGFLPGFFDTEKRGLKSKDLYFEAILSPKEAAEGGLFPVRLPVIEPCPRCNKASFLIDPFCPICSGYGKVRTEREFSLSIPPNVKNGTEIQLSMEDLGLRGSYLNIFVLIDDEQAP